MAVAAAPTFLAQATRRSPPHRETCLTRNPGTNSAMNFLHLREDTHLTMANQEDESAVLDASMARIASGANLAHPVFRYDFRRSFRQTRIVKIQPRPQQANARKPALLKTPGR